MLPSNFKINHIFSRNSNSNVQSAGGQLLAVQFNNALNLLIIFIVSLTMPSVFSD